jgi:hypothetical protein
MMGWADPWMGEQNISHVSIFKVALDPTRTHIILDFSCTDLHQYFLKSYSRADIGIPANNAYYSLRHRSLSDMLCHHSLGSCDFAFKSMGYELSDLHHFSSDKFPPFSRHVVFEPAS